MHAGCIHVGRWCQIVQGLEAAPATEVCRTDHQALEDTLGLCTSSSSGKTLKELLLSHVASMDRANHLQAVGM